MHLQRLGGSTRPAVLGVWVMIAALALAVGVSAGCAGLGRVTKDSTPEEKRAAVTERVNARWAALIQGDMDTAYTFFSPASRELLSLASYKVQARGSGFRKAEISGVDCKAEICDVKVMLTYDHPRMKGITTPIDETWVLTDGQYWLTGRQ